MLKLAFVLGLISCYFFAKRMGFAWCVIAYLLGALGLFGIHAEDALETGAPLTSFFRSQFGNLFLNIGYKALHADITMTIGGIITLLLIAMFLWLLLILGGFYVSTEIIISAIIVCYICSRIKEKKQIKKNNADKNYYWRFS